MCLSCCTRCACNVTPALSFFFFFHASTRACGHNQQFSCNHRTFIFFLLFLQLVSFFFFFPQVRWTPLASPVCAYGMSLGFAPHWERDEDRGGSFSLLHWYFRYTWIYLFARLSPGVHTFSVIHQPSGFPPAFFSFFFFSRSVYWSVIFAGVLVVCFFFFFVRLSTCFYYQFSFSFRGHAFAWASSFFFFSLSFFPFHFIQGYSTPNMSTIIVIVFVCCWLFVCVCVFFFFPVFKLHHVYCIYFHAFTLAGLQRHNCIWKVLYVYLQPSVFFFYPLVLNYRCLEKRVNQSTAHQG